MPNDSHPGAWIRRATDKWRLSQRMRRNSEGRLASCLVMLLGMSISVIFGVGTLVQAQESLGIDPRGRQRREPLPQLEEQPPAKPRPVLPPLPSVPPPGAPQSMPPLRVFARNIEVLGSTVFSDEELAKVTAPYTNREVTTEDLEALRIALTRLYVDHDYINSGAIIPNQTVRDGVITLQIIEGTLSTINIEDNRWFREGYIRRRLALGATPPLNFIPLQERLQLLQQDSRITRLQAELKPAVRRGDGILNVRVTESIPFFIEFAFDNYQSPTVGAETGSVALAARNVTGHGDIFRFSYGRSEGNDLQIDTSYTIPLTVYDTTLRLQYRRNTFTVIEEPFRVFNFESTSEVFGITLRHSFYRTLRQEFAMSLSTERAHNETLADGDPISLSLGAEDGESTVAAFRLAMEWTDRTPDQVVALRSQFTIGADVLGATIHDTRETPDSEFLAWLGQFQWARRLTPWGLQAIGRLDMQFSTDPLLSLEQFAVGGRYTVRGYRENQLVRDNGVVGSLEVRVPVIQNRAWADFIHLAPFVDAGSAWNTAIETPDPRLIASVGIGLRWALTLTRPVPWRSAFEMYWGYPIKDLQTEGGNLQDLGLHFRFSVSAF